MEWRPDSGDLACALLELGRLPAHAVPDALRAELREPLASFGYELERARELDCHSRRGREYVYLVQKAGYPVDFAEGGAESAAQPRAPSALGAAPAAARAPRGGAEQKKLQSYGVAGLTAPRAKASHETLSHLLSRAPHAVMRAGGAELDDLWPLLQGGYLLYSEGEDLEPGELLPQAAALCLHVPHVLLGRRALLEMADLLPEGAKCALCQGPLGFGPRCPGAGCGRAYHAECLYSTAVPSAAGARRADPRSWAPERPVRCTECGHAFTDEQVEFLRKC